MAREARGSLQVHGAKDLVRGGMDGVLRQKFEHGVALRGGPKGGCLECVFEFKAQFRHSLYLDYIQLSETVKNKRDWGSARKRP